MSPLQIEAASLLDCTFELKVNCSSLFLLLRWHLCGLSSSVSFCGATDKSGISFNSSQYSFHPSHGTLFINFIKPLYLSLKLFILVDFFLVSVKYYKSSTKDSTFQDDKSTKTQAQTASSFILQQ